MDAISRQTLEILEHLGDSPDSIALTLEARGICGVRNTVRFLNPIVRALQQALAGRRLNVDLMEPRKVRVTLEDRSVVEVALPPAVHEFLSAFDKGCYPQLEAR